MNRHALTKSLQAGGLIGIPLALVAIAGATVLSASGERTIVFFLLTVVVVLSIQLFSGPTGILSFGHVAFMGVGAYVAAMLAVSPGIKSGLAPALPAFILNAEGSWWLTLPAGLIAGGLVAGFVGLAFARMEEDAMAMATVALILIFGVLFNQADDLTGGAQGVYAIPRSTTMALASVFAVMMVILTQWFARSSIGTQLRASRSSPIAARSLGMRLAWLRWIAWTFAGGLIGLGGALWAGYSVAFAPGEFDFDLTFALLAALAIGGVGSVTGTVLGAAILTLVAEVLRRAEDAIGIDGLTQIGIALLILLILYRRPAGLLGVNELPEILSRWLRRAKVSGKQAER